MIHRLRLTETEPGLSPDKRSMKSCVIYLSRKWIPDINGDFMSIFLCGNGEQEITRIPVDYQTLIHGVLVIPEIPLSPGQVAFSSTATFIQYVLMNNGIQIDTCIAPVSKVIDVTYDTHNQNLSMKLIQFPNP